MPDPQGIIRLKPKPVPENTPYSLDDLISKIDENWTDFDQLWQSGEINENMFIAQDWTEKQKSSFKAQGRIPYSFPLVAGKFRQIAGLQTSLRTSFRADAISNPDNEVRADVAQTILRAAESRSKFKNIESEAFVSGAAMKYGVGKVTIENDGIENKMGFDEVDYRNFMWDLTDTSYELNKVLFTAEVEQRKVFELAVDGYDTSKITQDMQNGFGREFPNWYFGTNSNGDMDMGIVRIFHFYARTVRTYYSVVTPDESDLIASVGFNIPKVGTFANKSDAEILLRKVRLAYIMNGLAPEGWIVEHKKEVYDYYKFNYTGIMEYEALDVETHPYSVYFAIKFKDKFISFFDFLKSPQLFYDRMFAQIDYSIGKDSKTNKQLWIGGLDSRETPESAVRKLDETGETILSASPTPIITAIRTEGVKTEWLAINNIMNSLIEDVAGGAAFFGLSKGAESGVAIRNKQQLGQTMAQTLFDNLVRFKENLGRKAIIYHAHFINNEQTIRVSGSDLTPEMKQLLMNDGLFIPSQRTKNHGYLTINKKGYPHSFIIDDDLEITIGTAPLTETEKEAKFVMLQEARQNDPRLANSIVYYELMLQNMPNLDEGMRQALLEEYKAQIQAEQAQAEKESQREDMKLQIQMFKAMSDSSAKGTGNKIKAEEAKTDRIAKTADINQERKTERANILEA